MKNFAVLALLLLYSQVNNVLSQQAPVPAPVEQVVAVPVVPVTAAPGAVSVQPPAPEQVPAPAPPPKEVTDAVNNAVRAAQDAQNAAAAAVAAALAAQRALEVSTQQPGAAQPPMPIAAAAGTPGSTAPQQPQGGGAAPGPVTETFAVPGFEQAQAQAGAEGGSTQQGAVVGLAAPSAEVQQVISERGGVPVQAVPENLPERLRTSLAGEKPNISG